MGEAGAPEDSLSLTEEPGESDREGHHGGQILALLCPSGKFLNLSEPQFSPVKCSQSLLS